MKTISTYSIFVAIFFIALLSSCASFQGEFAQRKYYDFPRTKHTVNATASITTQEQALPVVPTATIHEHGQPASSPVLSASVYKKEIIPAAENNDKIVNKTRSNIKLDYAAPTENTDISFKQSEIKDEAKKNAEHFPSSADDDSMLILLVILAIFIPPLAIYLKHNDTTKRFWITLILCLLGIVGYWVIPLSGLLWLVAAIIAILDVLDKL